MFRESGQGIGARKLAFQSALPALLRCFQSERRGYRRQNRAGHLKRRLTRGKSMATTSSIEWTEMTWNPVTGCYKVSQGCKHCYAERMAKRLHAMGAPRYANGFK